MAICEQCGVECEKRVKSKCRRCYVNGWNAANRDKARATGRRGYAKHKEAKKEYGRKWSLANREYMHERLRKRNHEVTNEVFYAMLDQQAHSCAICGRNNDGRGKGKTFKELAIDHCHDSGRIRGLLCDSCNTAIGHLRDSPEICERAAEYLRRTYSPKKEESANE